MKISCSCGAIVEVHDISGSAARVFAAHHSRCTMKYRIKKYLRKYLKREDLDYLPDEIFDAFACVFEELDALRNNGEAEPSTKWKAYRSAQSVLDSDDSGKFFDKLAERIK